MSEATTAIAKLRNNKLNPNYRPMIFVIAPFTEVVKGDAKAIMAVRSYCRFVYQKGGIPVCPQLYLPQFINLHHSKEFQIAAFINIVLLTKCVEKLGRLAIRLTIHATSSALPNGKIRKSGTLTQEWRITKMHFTLSVATNSGQTSNTIYPNQLAITNPQELKQAVQYDHVCGLFKNNQRNIGNFIKADCLVMDCDNDHSDDPAAWINPTNLVNYFDDVSYAITLSRNNMKTKNKKAPRPKFHIYFPINEIGDARIYAELKHEIQEYFPYFDDNALDAARFVFGVPNTETSWHEGEQTIDQFMMAQRYFAQQKVGSIHEGKRNATLSHFAGRIIMRLGNTAEAQQAFQDEAAKCDPPLKDQERRTIWHSAIKFGQRMASQKGYIPPEEYNQPNDDLRPDDYSDTGESYVFVDNCKDRVCYTNQSGFMWFDGKVWQESEPLALGEVQRFTDKQLNDAQLRVAKAYQVIQQNGVSRDIQTMGKTKASRSFNDDQQAAFKDEKCQGL